MTLPKVNININSGGLGRVPSLADGTSALLLTGKKKQICQCYGQTLHVCARGL